jgi:hypothetical protein
MTNPEKLLLILLRSADDQNVKAIVLQSFIAEFGPLSEEAAKLVREQLKVKQ